MAHLQKLNCRCEVTAVKFICDGSILITAQGPFLSVYDSAKGIYLDSYQLLYANKIHGIRTHSITFNDIEYIIIICFGARELSISALNSNTSKIDLVHSPFCFDDWIFDAKILLMRSTDDEHEKKEDNKQPFELVIGMMHAQVLLYSISFESDPFHSKLSLSHALIDTIFTDNTSILYSLSFYGSNRNNLMIAAGDCFNHLLLWNVFDVTKNKKNEHENKSKIKFRGRRKGAIYDISWSADGKYLCYVSDDRSVQLWQFNDANSLQMVYRVYGHDARVFKCWISPNAQYVVSCSEDSTCRVWNFDGECIDIFEFRYGQIWSVDVWYKSIKNINLYHVALGGADSSIRFHYFLSKKEEDVFEDIKTIALNNDGNRNSLPCNDLTPFQHHVDSKAFYQINLPNKYFPRNNIKKKSKKRGKKRNSEYNIRIMTIDSESRIVFATARDIYRVSNLSAETQERIKWEKIIALKDIFGEHRNKKDEITTIQLSRDLFSDYGHYRTMDDSLMNLDKHPSDLLSKMNIGRYAEIPEDASDSHSLLSTGAHASAASLKTSIKQTDQKIAENLHKEYERWLVIGTKLGKISIVDLSTNQNALCFRAHDIGIISIYLCITSFQPETLESINMTETQKRYRARGAKKYYSDMADLELSQTNKLNKGEAKKGYKRLLPKLSGKNQLRFSLSASDLHSVMSNPSLNEEYLRMWGNSSLMLFTSDGNGHITYWCFPLSELQKPKASTANVSQTKQEDEPNDDDEDSEDDDRASNVSNVSSATSVKFDTIQSAIKSSATFINPAKKQICAFCYLPPPKNVLIVGDSRGNIMLFSLSNLQHRLMHKPQQILKAMHGREPVSVIKALGGIKYIHDETRKYKTKREWREELSSQEDDSEDTDASFSFYDGIKDEKYHIVSGGKDGKIVEYSFYDKKEYDAQGGIQSLLGTALSTLNASSTHHKVRKSRSASDYNLKSMINDDIINQGDGEILVPIRPIASTSLSSIDDIVLNDNNEMICSGFRSTDFIVWNIKMDYVLFRWNCGGVKRPHHFQLLYFDDPAKKNKNAAALLNPCRGWIFAYTNSNLSNCIAVYHLDLPSPIPLGNVSRPYHSSEIHALHWLLSPKEIYKMCARDDIFSEIEDFVATKDMDENEKEYESVIAAANMVNKPLSTYFKKLMIASSGEDGLIQIVSIANGNNEIHPPNIKATRNKSSSRALASMSPRRSRRPSRSRSSIDADYSSAIFADDDSKLYDAEWILKFNPLHAQPGKVINICRQSIMEQNAGSRFPLKCCDMVRTSNGDAYLLFGGGAKEYLQGYQVSYNITNPSNLEWKSLCCTGGDTNKLKSGWKQHLDIEQNAIENIDLRIKSIVVIPNPKFFKKWLIITGNSRGTIRAYTLDEEKPTEFQFEGEDSILHRDNNASSPIISLCSTYSSETNYHFGGNNSNTSPFNHYNHYNNYTREKSTLSSYQLSVESRIVPNYNELPPHLIFSGATDGWIRIWFWDIDTHSIQLVTRLAIHQNGVNTISVSWLDAKFRKVSLKKQKSAPVKQDYDDGDALLTRRLAILTGGDDQSMTLIIGDFESTMSMARVSAMRSRQRKRANKLLVRKSMSSNTLQINTHSTDARSSLLASSCGWRFNVIREIPINTAHVASIRCVIITPIITPNIVEYFNNQPQEDKNVNLRMNEMLLFSTGDDQKLKCWSYKFKKRSVIDDNSYASESVDLDLDDLELRLLDEAKLDIGLPNCASMYYIYNSGILLAIAGAGIQICALPFSKYLFKTIYRKNVNKYATNSAAATIGLDNVSVASHEDSSQSSFLSQR